MTVWLIRHGRTEWNDTGRYQGQTDLPLSNEGAAELARADFSPKTVYVTPLKRTQETARILFPDARQIVIDDLREMDFGAFEGDVAKAVISEAFKNGLIVERVGRRDSVVKVMPELKVPLETLEKGLQILAQSIRNVVSSL